MYVNMADKRRFLLLPAALILLLGTLLWAFWSGSMGRPLSRAAQAKIIRQMAEQPSSWRGWSLLHSPDPDWTDPRRAEQPVQPVPQPLTPPEPFFLVDGSQSLTPEKAASEALYGMLHYIRANKAGQGYTLLEFRVGEPKLLGREEVMQMALEACSTPERSRWTEDQLRAWCRSFFRRYPGLGKEMWIVEPAFSLKWSGEIDSIPYDACVSSGMADPEGFVDLPNLFRHRVRSSPLLLIRQGHQYRLQHAEAFFAQYEDNARHGRLT